jgi:endonuclease/exonuclease/phosphatase family metal-dependent hydrolase
MLSVTPNASVLIAKSPTAGRLPPENPRPEKRSSGLKNNVLLGELRHMQTRRIFLKTALAASAVSLAIPSGLALAADPGARRLRAITYNVLKCQGYAVTPEAKPFLKAAAAQVPTRLALELALYEPDIITFQEGPPEKVLATIADQLGMNHAFFAGGWHGAVLSKFEIVEQQNCPLASGSERPKELFTRHWGRAVLRAPGGDLSLFSAHLHPSDASVRAREVSEMLKVMAPSLEKGGPVILQGDLNHPPGGPEYARWLDAGLVDSFDRKEADTSEFSINSHTPAKRIDYVWTCKSLARRGGDCRILFERAFRTNPADPRSVALSDHIPVMADFTL